MPSESTRKVYLHLYHGRYSIIFIYLRCSRSFDTRQCYYAYLIPKTKKNIGNPQPKACGEHCRRNHVFANLCMHLKTYLLTFQTD